MREPAEPGRPGRAAEGLDALAPSCVILKEQQPPEASSQQRANILKDSTRAMLVFACVWEQLELWNFPPKDT